MADTPKVRFESRMLIDGKLVDGQAGTFVNINPANEEVLVVISYDDDEDAIRIANDSAYGLAGNVMSGSLEHSLAVARRLRAGFVGVNGGAAYGADVPFGGYKASGVGRQNGLAGFDQYTEIKSVGYPVG
jgi:aldehyde dehydrogenase (NAD+)